MTLPSPFTLPRSQFNAFLFASIGEEGNGMPLSVVSALARLKIDPWQEAARLSDLPEDRAVAALDHLIRLLPTPGWDQAETRHIAARLVALLPHHVAPAARRSGSADKPRSRAVVWLLVAALGATAIYSVWANGAERWDDRRGVQSSTLP